MAKKFRIFADVSAGTIIFDGSRIPPAPLGGKVLASDNGSGRVRVVYTDRFGRDGVTPRRIFKGLKVGRIKNEANQILFTDLGFDLQQIIDYINDQANKKVNEIDIQNDGALVGGGTTLNFKGAIDFITVSDDVASICIDQVGIATTGGYVGTGVTLFDFRGSGISTITSPTAGVATIFIEGGDVDSIDGSKITGTIDSTQLSPHITGLGGVNFTLGDSDPTPAFNLTDATGYQYSNLVGIPASHSTTINEFEWYQQYLSPGAGFSTEGPGITTTNPPTANNPFYYGVQLKPYQQMEWGHVAEDNGSVFVGKWGGSTSYDPANSGHQSLWEKMLRIRRSSGNGHHVSFESSAFDSIGFAHTGHASNRYEGLQAGDHLILRYDGDDNKLKLINQDDSNHVVGTASTAENGSPITISFAITDNIHVPGISTVRYYKNQTNFKFHNTNDYLENNQHDKDKGVVYYDTKVKRGEELVFSLPSGPVHVGIWDGGTGITGISNVNNKSNWSTKFRYSSEDTRWQNANTTIGKVGIDQSVDIETDAGTFAIRFDHQTEKLQLWNIDTAYDWHIATANVAVGATETYIYFSSGGNTQTTPPESLPGISTLRSQDFTLRSYTDAARPGDSFYDGTKVNDVWKSNKSLRPGMKVKFTVPTTAGNQYWATNFEGTEDLGSGENNAYQAGEMTWRLTNQEKFTAHEDATVNANYTAMDTSTTTLALPGRNMSWRYNADNTWDIFDEDTDEVVLTGDDTLDGGDMYPYLLAVNNSDDVLSDYVQFEWEWSNANWFTEYRDYVSGASGTKFISKIPNGKPLKTYTQGLPTQSGGFYYLGNANYMVTWGEKMRPGQEFSWTQLVDNSNGSNKNNLIIGVLNSSSDAFTTGIRFKQTGQPKNQSDQDSGFTISAGIDDTTACSGKSMRLQYEYGTNKLVCYSVSAGVRTKLGESTSALDGNPIFITMGGESTRIPVTQGVSVYGWETAHQPPSYYNPWDNWRIGGFPENQDLGGVGIHSTGQVLAHKADQVLRHRDGLASGYKMHWVTPASATNTRIGQWKTSNPVSGQTNVENNTEFWDWSWRLNTSEEIIDLDGMTFNTSNSNYDASSDPSAPIWDDPNPGTTKISIRYHANNSLDIFDESNSEIIATKDADCDGNPIYISAGFGGATNNSVQMMDDFFGGGDVGIALTTTAV